MAISVTEILGTDSLSGSRLVLSTILLDINASTFDVLTNVNMTGNLNLNGGGLFRNDQDPQPLDDTFAAGSPIPVGTSTAIPPYTIERVFNTDVATPVSILLNDGAIGQEIFFVYSDAQTGVVSISGAVTPLVLPGGTNIELNAQGDTAHLLCADDGTGNGIWFLVGGTGYSIV